jgi:hypothetical protein
VVLERIGVPPRPSTLEVTMTRLVTLLALVIVTNACSGESLSTLPTAPSVLAGASTSSASARPAATKTVQMVYGLPLVWDVAEGCLIQKPALPPTGVTDTAPLRAFLLGEDEVNVAWQDPEGPLPAQIGSWWVEYVYKTNFKKQGDEWRACGWSGPYKLEIHTCTTTGC